MTDKEVIELNSLASACRAIHEDERFEFAYRMANLINARDVASIAYNNAEKGKARDTAKFLMDACEKSLQKEADNQKPPDNVTPIEL